MQVAFFPDLGSGIQGCGIQIDGKKSFLLSEGRRNVMGWVTLSIDLLPRGMRSILLVLVADLRGKAFFPP